MALCVFLGASDAVFLNWYWRQGREFVRVIYVGIDSLSVILPASEQGAALIKGKWTPALAKTEIPQYDIAGKKTSIDLITLAPQPTYENFIKSILDLRAQNRCHALIREGGILIKAEPGSRGNAAVDRAIPTLVLCGSPIGDAAFMGTLPRDRIVKLDQI